MAVFMTLASLGACDANRETDGGEAPAPVSTASPAPEPEPTEVVSILRPDVEAEQELEEELPLEPLNVIISFSGGGSNLDDAAQLALQEVLTSEQIAQGGPIVLGAHSDAGGSDLDNERISRERGEQVREWFIENDITEDRIEIVAFGEQNPLEPNALPDGSRNEAGRAVNRRVEIQISMPESETE